MIPGYIHGLAARLSEDDLRAVTSLVEDAFVDGFHTPPETSLGDCWRNSETAERLREMFKLAGERSRAPTFPAGGK